MLTGSGTVSKLWVNSVNCEYRIAGRCTPLLATRKTGPWSPKTSWVSNCLPDTSDKHLFTQRARLRSPTGLKTKHRPRTQRPFERHRTWRWETFPALVERGIVLHVAKGWRL